MMTFVLEISRKIVLVSGITTRSMFNKTISSKLEFVVSIPTMLTFKVNL